jgi:ATP-dependent helicase HrpA
MREYHAASLKLNLWDLISPDERQRLLDLPSTVEIRGKWIDIDYDIEPAGEGEQGTPVARLRLPEKLARSLVDEELPALDRPLRFTVLRGPRGAVRASSLAELQDLLDKPWSPDEQDVSRPRRNREDRTHRRPAGQRDRRGGRGEGGSGGGDRRRNQGGRKRRRR